MMIDPKYLSVSIWILTEEERHREQTMPKSNTTVDLFTDDVDMAKKLGINMSRIIRMKFHEWLHEKVTPKPG